MSYLTEHFLSRLCGGLRVKRPEFCGGTFLSRLCGGLRCNKRTASVVNFLSRLCGGLRLNVFQTFHASVSKPPVRRLTAQESHAGYTDCF